jgi:hypothetical protein
MRYTTRRIVYPEGDTAEIDWPLRFNQLVGVDGRPLGLPLTTTRLIAYRVYRVSTNDTRNEQIVEYHLEQLFPEQLRGYLG